MTQRVWVVLLVVVLMLVLVVVVVAVVGILPRRKDIIKIRFISVKRYDYDDDYDVK
jgi:hypothetical protein